MDFLYYLVKIAVIALQIVKPFDPSHENDLVAKPSIANIPPSPLTDLLSIDLSDEAKMMELERQAEIDSGIDLEIGRKKSGLIFLHGLFTPGTLNAFTELIVGPSLGLSTLRNKIVAPTAPKQPIHLIPSPLLPPNRGVVRSWFDFWSLPGTSVISPIATESKEDLEQAMKWVEAEIDKMIAEGIPKENIVLMGHSQGGSLALYTAMHTKYKIGGFIPIATWAPLLKVEPPTSMPVPINKGTPIFHMNGKQDLIAVPPICGRETSKAFDQVFTKYTQKDVLGTHLSLVNPLTIPRIYCWIKKNVPHMERSRVHPLRFTFCSFFDETLA